MTRFVQSRNYYKGRQEKLRLIVWHSMEAPERTTTAENVANYFKNLVTPKASAHICVDSDSVVECVWARDTAFAAPGANADGYQVELAGIRNQGHAGWRDAFSLATIANACRFIADKPDLDHIPDRWLTDAQLRDGVSAGHTTHEQVTRVFKKSDHLDPGPDFPKDYVMEQMRAARRPAVPVPTPAPVTGSTLSRKVIVTGSRVLGMSEPKMEGTDVRDVQNALIVAGYLSDHPDHRDGVYDRAVSDAASGFKAANDIAEAGVGPKTLAALRRLVHS